MAEMIYRLKANVTTKTSKTYDILNGKGVAIPLGQESSGTGLPARIKIPSIHVDAIVEQVGLTPEGAVDVPKDPANAAWYDLGPLPGTEGSSVITGHVNWYNGAKGVFENLGKVKPGDRIEVVDDRGLSVFFIVREARSYDADAHAADVFISSDGKSHLNLITCEGVWDSRAKQYTQRRVVFADREVE
jgi:LPXTG-site transpeptidase (sortase) family protein